MGAGSNHIMYTAEEATVPEFKTLYWHAMHAVPIRTKELKYAEMLCASGHSDCTAQVMHNYLVKLLEEEVTPSVESRKLCKP